MGWIIHPPPASMIDALAFNPVTDWKRIFVIYRKIDNRKVFFKFVYKRKYRNFFGSGKSIYKQTIFDILK